MTQLILQNIDFFEQIERPVGIPFSLRKLIVALLLVLVIGLLILLYLGVLNSRNGDKVENNTANIRALDVRLSTLNAEKSALLAENTLDQEIKQLVSARNFRRQLLSSVGTQDEQRAMTGFAEHMLGLGRQIIDGIWFTRIRLLHGGGYTELEGKAKAPELLPKYLQKLAAEQSYAGKTFSVFKMQKPEEDERVLVFDVRSSNEVLK